MPSEEPDPSDEDDHEESEDDPDEVHSEGDKEETEDLEEDEVERSSEGSEEPNTEDRDEEDDKSSGSAFSPSWLFGEDFEKVLRGMGTIQLKQETLEALTEDVRASEESLARAAQQSIRVQKILDQFNEQQDLNQIVEANRSLARSINPEIFEIYSDIEQSAAIDLYETVAALNQLEAEASPATVEDEEEEKSESEDKEEEERETTAEADETTQTQPDHPPAPEDAEPEGTETPTIGEWFETTSLDLIARYVLNDRGMFTEQDIEYANAILDSDSNLGKRQAYNNLLEHADNTRKQFIDYATRLVIGFLLLFLPLSTEQ